MTIVVLQQSDFAAAVAESDVLVVGFSASANDGPLAAAAQRLPETRFAVIDAAAEDALHAMFGLTAGPALLVFRQQIVMYLEAGEHSANRIEQLVTAIMALDMDQVRADIEEQKRAEIALRMRRVCPATRRIPGGA